MALKIIETADGSRSIYNDTLDETYHSRHGALQEAKHVFIKMGLLPLLSNKEQIDILEIGLGTGLNAWLTCSEVFSTGNKVNYTGVEAYPLSEEELKEVNYSNLSDKEEEKGFLHTIQRTIWEEKVDIHPNFSLTKRKMFFDDIKDVNSFDLIYFDAFGPMVQPDLWTVEIFTKMFNALRSGGVLVTYSAKGDVRRAMLSVGFDVEKVEGPPGKREMLVAKKK